MNKQYSVEETCECQCHKGQGNCDSISLKYECSSDKCCKEAGQIHYKYSGISKLIEQELKIRNDRLKILIFE